MNTVFAYKVVGKIFLIMLFLDFNDVLSKRKPVVCFLELFQIFLCSRIKPLTPNLLLIFPIYIKWSYINSN